MVWILLLTALRTLLASLKEMTCTPSPPATFSILRHETLHSRNTTRSTSRHRSLHPCSSVWGVLEQIFPILDPCGSAGGGHSLVVVQYPGQPWNYLGRGSPPVDWGP